MPIIAQAVVRGSRRIAHAAATAAPSNDAVIAATAPPSSLLLARARTADVQPTPCNPQAAANQCYVTSGNRQRRFDYREVTCAADVVDADEQRVARLRRERGRVYVAVEPRLQMKSGRLRRAVDAADRRVRRARVTEHEIGVQLRGRRLRVAVGVQVIRAGRQGPAQPVQDRERAAGSQAAGSEAVHRIVIVVAAVGFVRRTVAFDQLDRARPRRARGKHE